MKTSYTGPLPAATRLEWETADCFAMVCYCMEQSMLPEDPENPTRREWQDEDIRKFVQDLCRLVVPADQMDYIACRGEEFVQYELTRGKVALICPRPEIYAQVTVASLDRWYDEASTMSMEDIIPQEMARAWPDSYCRAQECNHKPLPHRLRECGWPQAWEQQCSRCKSLVPKGQSCGCWDNHGQ